MKKVFTALLICSIFISNLTLMTFAKEQNNNDNPETLVDENIKSEGVVKVSNLTLNGENIELSGWLGIDSDNYDVAVKIDGQKTNAVKIIDNQDNPDYIEGFRNKENFMLSESISDFEVGEHKVIVEVATVDGIVIAFDEKAFTIRDSIEQDILSDDLQSSNQESGQENSIDTIQPAESLIKNVISENLEKNSASEKIVPSANIFLDMLTFTDNTLKLSGWSMCNIANSYIQVVVDGKILDGGATRVERGDVIAGIKGFGSIVENPKPGFTSELLLKNLSYGEHEVNIRTVVGTTVLSNIIKRINVDVPKTMINFEDMKVTEGMVNIVGWAMSSADNTYLQLLVDGRIVASNLTRTEREDVLAVMKGYGDRVQNPKPGFQSVYDISSLKKGDHEIQVRVVQNGVILGAAYKTLFVEEAKNRIMIESAYVNDGLLTVAGWAMTSVNNTHLRILLDNGVINSNMKRVSRGDVLEVIKDCGTSKQNPLPGFNESIDITNFGVGSHELVIQIMQGSDIIASEKKTIQVQPYNSMVFIDNANIKNHIVTINGWALSNNPNMNLELYVNGVKVNATIERSKRDDVLAAIKGYGNASQNQKPGYNIKADINGFSSGNNDIQVRAVYGTNYLSAQTISLINDAYKTNMNVDQVKMDGNRVNASGWVMSDNRSNRVQFLVDGTVVADNIQRSLRPDVQNTIVGFGSAADNPMPGFTGSVDLSGFAPGNHNFQVRVVSKTGELLSARTQVIRTRGTGNLGVDVSEHNGYINWSTTANYVDFAIIRAGWGYFTEDKNFRSNIKGCEQNNVPYGIYFYSYALNMEEAKKEVDGLLKALEGTNPELPVYIDMEDADYYKLNNGFPSNEMLQNICAYFCERVSAAGYRTGIYASLSWFNGYLNSVKLDKYDKWVAQWNTQCDYQKPYYMWQFTSDGSVPGISSARVDMNYSYYK